MNIAVLAVQGAFIEHENIIKKLGHNVIELRQKKDLDNDFDGLILPGGESTVQGKLLKDLDMFDILKEKIENGLPVFATCAGLILLSESLSNDNKKHFATLPVKVNDNIVGVKYKNQIGISFHPELTQDTRIHELFLELTKKE